MKPFKSILKYVNLHTSTERKKWTIEKPPEGYPTDCSRRTLNEAIKDFSEEFINRTVKDDKDFYNKGWRDRIVVFIQLGQSELQQRNNNKVLIVSVITLEVALIAIFI